MNEEEEEEYEEKEESSEKTEDIFVEKESKEEILNNLITSHTLRYKNELFIKEFNRLHKIYHKDKKEGTEVSNKKKDLEKVSSRLKKVDNRKSDSLKYSRAKKESNKKIYNIKFNEEIIEKEKKIDGDENKRKKKKEEDADLIIVKNNLPKKSKIEKKKSRGK